MKTFALSFLVWLFASCLVLPQEVNRNLGQGKTIVFMIGENEYETKTTLPEFAHKELEPRGFRCLFTEAPSQGGNEFTNATVIKDADLLVVSIRRRTPRKEIMDLVRQHVLARKPVVGIRTASHAFDAKPPSEDYAAWPTFDVDVLGAKYENHYNNKGPEGPGTTIKTIPETSRHPVLMGVPAEGFHSTSHLYKYRNLVNTATPVLNGTIAGESVVEPLAWANTGQNRRVFYTSLGNPDDFGLAPFRRLLLNGILWSLEIPIPQPEGAAVDKPHALSPAESFSRFKVADDLEIEQVLTEPLVEQPVSISFDERGRMWVVQYRQYPSPAGLKMTSRDQYWRAVYDKVPPAPPHHFKGLDRITIHEDTDGDGIFDKHKVFVDGLNIATAAARGRGGVWVLNPPYLLFYPDANNDDQPDGDPVVHLSGFGLEDTHSVVNSLRWGPDGWLYAAQGSTVTASIIRPGLDKEPVHSMGQLIWRYQPETHRYEVFAEGGGNTFGVEIDSKGRIFSGHNGGNTRGFYYVQGGYLQKGFSKHGPLSNPYAFGYFPAMPNNDVERFTHTFIIYDGGTLPETYHGKLLGVEPLQGRVVLSDFQPNGSSFRTLDLSHPVTTTDKFFRPVDIEVGPDGALYVADWYDVQVNHYRNHEGQIDTSNGRIYRIKAKGASPAKPFDLSKLSGEQLVELLGHTNKWYRQVALRLLGDRKDSKLVPLLSQKLATAEGQRALELLWALNLSGGFNDAVALKTLNHSDPYVRLWTARLLCDNKQVSSPIAEKLASMAGSEPNVEVRSQLASSARRLPARESLAIVRPLLGHTEDLKDPQIPLLLWWDLEAKAESDREAVVALFEKSDVWQFPIVQQEIISRLMRRYAMAGTQKDLMTCSRLLELAPDKASAARLVTGFEEAFKGRPLATLPDALAQNLAKSGATSLALGVRLGRPDAVAKALDAVQNDGTKRDERLLLIETFGEVKQPDSVKTLLKIAQSGNDSSLRKAAITALQSYTAPEIAPSIIASYNDFSEPVRLAAQTLLASRPAWALQLLEAVDQGKVAKGNLSISFLKRLDLGKDERIHQLIAKHWTAAELSGGGQFEDRIQHFAQVIRADLGDPYAGKKLFRNTCSTCHRLFDEGGQVGPDLTTYKRDDLENILLNVINPSAEIREGYENVLVATKDGRTLSGFLADQDNRIIVLRGLDAQNIIIARNEIDSMKSAGISLMPEGLLDGLDDRQVRDLFAYLRSTQPLNDGN